MSVRTLAAAIAGMLLLLSHSVSHAGYLTNDEPPINAFAADLEQTRQVLRIPGMSAAVVREGELVWAEGFGYADVENQVPATADTPYGLASVTKPIAATLIMQLVEEGLIDIDAPVAQYGLTADGLEGVTVRHLLTHTSEGTPGTSFHYNGDRYALLGGVINGATGQTFAELLSQRILLLLEMTDTALNPINAWEGPATLDLDDLQRPLGWGESFAHYPDVYRRLARPYQFNEDYDIIPGMYHLSHSPAAGLVSSVSDLAAFDIALDQGQLLNDQSLEQMWTPAFPIHTGRDDLMYGLGWYTQDFDGLGLRWHTGRWPPSTSALYLKAPSEDLTFIVLANTDNLTVPFFGLGKGDVTKSLLALTFMRHFIFPRQHGYALPVVDWQGGERQLVAQLTAVEDEASREFLERELWAYRQAFASTGRQDMVSQLERVNRRVNPDSPFSRDELFTATSGQFPVISPVMPASSLVLLTRAAVIWLGMVLISLALMIVWLAREPESSGWLWFVWLLTSLILGPLALFIRWLVQREVGEPAPDKWRQAAGASGVSVSGYALAWTAVLLIMTSLPGDTHPLIFLGTAYLIPLLVGLVLIKGPLLLRRSHERPARALLQGLLSEVLTMNIAFAVLFPLTLLAQDKVFSVTPTPDNPYFGVIISVIALAGFLALYPLAYVLSRRGYSIWPVPRLGSDTVPILPQLRDAWWLLLITVAVAVAALALSIAQLGG